jgi:hypothetical protein
VEGGSKRQSTQYTFVQSSGQPEAERHSRNKNNNKGHFVRDQAAGLVELDRYKTPVDLTYVGYAQTVQKEKKQRKQMTWWIRAVAMTSSK